MRLKLLEQHLTYVVFLDHQLLQYCDMTRKRRNLTRRKDWNWKLRVQFGGATLVAVAQVATWSLPSPTSGLSPPACAASLSCTPRPGTPL